MYNSIYLEETNYGQNSPQLCISIEEKDNYVCASLSGCLFFLINSLRTHVRNVYIIHCILRHTQHSFSLSISIFFFPLFFVQNCISFYKFLREKIVYLFTFLEKENFSLFPYTLMIKHNNI